MPLQSLTHKLCETNWAKKRFKFDSSQYIWGMRCLVTREMDSTVQDFVRNAVNTYMQIIDGQIAYT